jgi:hypothetical protein
VGLFPQKREASYVEHEGATVNRKDIIRMAREAGDILNAEWLQRFAAIVAAAKQEQCAQIAERLGADFAVIEAIRNA